MLRKSGIKLPRFQQVLTSDCFECGLQAGFAHCFGFPAIVLGLTNKYARSSCLSPIKSPCVIARRTLPGQATPKPA